MKAAIAAGKKSSLKRVHEGIPIMMEYIAIIQELHGGVPIGVLVVKGAFESKGNPSAVSSSKEIGLFQLRPAHAADFGFTEEDLMDPRKNTLAAVNLMEKRAYSFLDSHIEYFPDGMDWQFWGVQLLATMIGPGATRHLLNQVSAGGNSFSRLCSFVENHAAWMEEPEQDTNWGSQSGRLVAFRVMIARKLLSMAQDVETGYWSEETPSIAPGRAGRAVVIATGLVGIVSCVCLVGWTAHTGRIA